MPTITAVDDMRQRCDRCGARAHYAAHKGPAMELLFCGHHYMETRLTLLATGWYLSALIDVPA